MPPDAVRRAAMMAGDTEPVAVARARRRRTRRRRSRRFTLVVGRPVRPMLAQSAPDVDGAWASLGPGPVVVDTKLDGIRIQVHRRAIEVRVFTRSLDEITDRVPEIVAVVPRHAGRRSWCSTARPWRSVPDGRPRPFQETSARSATKDAEVAAAVTLTPFFFDCLHVDGADLLDAPLLRRLDALDAVAGCVRRGTPGHRRRRGRPQRTSPTPCGAGQEGVVIKAADAPYEAGRRGAAWIKVKPRQHPRPRRARGRVGLRTPAGAAVEHPPRRPRRRRVRDARQDVQGHDRRDAALADRAVHRARDVVHWTAGWCTCGPSRSSRSRSTGCSGRPATRAAWPCGSRGCCATGTTRRRPRRTRSRRYGPCLWRIDLGTAFGCVDG